MNELAMAEVLEDSIEDEDETDLLLLDELRQVVL
jgi:hypothetical protein